MEKIKKSEYGQLMLEGVVVMCLRDKFRQSVHETNRIHIRAACSDEITKIILEAEFDPKLDPPLYKACQDTIKNNCPDTVLGQVNPFYNKTVNLLGWPL